MIRKKCSVNHPAQTVVRPVDTIRLKPFLPVDGSLRFKEEY